MNLDEGPLSRDDVEKVINRYTNRFEEHGYSEEALGWGRKGRQQLRFEVLASQWDLKGKKILDLGAGFGDLYSFLQKYDIASYRGIELTPALCEEGQRRNRRDTNFELILGDCSDSNLYGEPDYVFISGLFNYKLLSGNNYEFIELVLSNAASIASSGIACNFITDRVDYTEELIFNARPEKILSLALSLSKNIVLRSDYMPFEYSLFISKIDTFSPESAVFDSYQGKS